MFRNRNGRVLECGIVQDAHAPTTVCEHRRRLEVHGPSVRTPLQLLSSVPSLKPSLTVPPLPSLPHSLSPFLCVWRSCLSWPAVPSGSWMHNDTFLFFAVLHRCLDQYAVLLFDFFEQFWPMPAPWERPQVVQTRHRDLTLKLHALRQAKPFFDFTRPPQFSCNPSA